MTEKTYTWPEAWDLMVNHGKKMRVPTWTILGYIFLIKKERYF